MKKLKIKWRRFELKILRFIGWKQVFEQVCVSLKLWNIHSDKSIPNTHGMHQTDFYREWKKKKKEKKKEQNGEKCFPFYSSMYRWPKKHVWHWKHQQWAKFAKLKTQTHIHLNENAFIQESFIQRVKRKKWLRRK